MENIHSFHSLVDGIFEELFQFSNVELHCKNISSVRNNGITSAVKLDAVNDCCSADAYRNFLNDLCISSLNRIMDSQKGLELPAKLLLFDLALKRCRRLSSASVQVSGDKNPGREIKTWMFRHVVITLDGQNCTDAGICEVALRQSGHHARIWHLIMKSLYDRLYCLSCIAGYTMPFLSQNQLPTSPHKIKSCCTVAIAAALTRILYENDVFQTYNKAELCRQVADLISTPNQPEVSAKSFKNLFDNPDPQTLLRLETEFGKWMKISEKLREYK